MRKKFIYTIVIILLCLNSEAQEVICDNVYQIEIPNDMWLMDQHPDATFEIANYENEHYLMVIHESKSDFKQLLTSKKNNILEEYTTLLADGLSEAFGNSESVVSNINFTNYKAKKIEVAGFSEGVRISWHTITVETELYLYQICYWTLINNNEKKSMSKLFNVAKTFDEL